MRDQNLLTQPEHWLNQYRETGPLLLRLFFSFVLMYGTMDNVFSTDRMYEFRDFLDQNSFPWPLASAYLSAYAHLYAAFLF